MRKTKVLVKFQEMVAREIRVNSPKDSSEVVLRPIGKKLILCLFKKEK